MRCNALTGQWHGTQRQPPHASGPLIRITLSFLQPVFILWPVRADPASVGAQSLCKVLEASKMNFRGLIIGSAL